MRSPGARCRAIALLTLVIGVATLAVYPAGVRAQSGGTEPAAGVGAQAPGSEPATGLDSQSGSQEPANQPGPVPIADVPPEDVAEIARNLNCPLCQGYNLQDCPLEVCAQMRELIRERLAAGQSRDEIVAAFVVDYGPQVLNEPPRSGFFLGAWVLPIAALILGVIAVALYVRRSVAAPRPGDEESSASPASGGELDERYVRQLEEMAGREDE